MAGRLRESKWKRWLATGLAAAVLSVVIVTIGWALFAPAADWLARHDVGSATGTPLETAQNNARGSLLTLAAGVLAAGALIFTARNFALQRRTFELTEQSQVTDRFTKAIEQLGSDKLDVRIGGIFALERIARDSERDHPTVMEVLTAFIREHSHDQWPPTSVNADSVPPSSGHLLSQGKERRSARPDVQAALTVIGRRDPRRDLPGMRINLTLANLTHANLSDASLSGADLRYTDLTGAYLDGADLTDAYLTGAYLDGADLTEADLSGADLRDTDLPEANLSGANLSGANLTGADLPGANLSGADLSGAYLTGANLDEAKLMGADLTGAELGDAVWPTDAPVPEGWTLDPLDRQLSWTGTKSAPVEEN